MGALATALMCLTTVATGCPGPPADPLPPPHPFAIKFEKSGGLKPLPMALTIRPGRRAVASMAGGGSAATRTVRFRVTRKKVAQLEVGLRRAHYFQLESPPPGNCADCFIYSFDYRGHELTIDQSALPQKLGDVVTKLETLVFEHVVMPSPGELPHRPFH
jgi:hypothetical protein